MAIFTDVIYIEKTILTLIVLLGGYLVAKVVHYVIDHISKKLAKIRHLRLTPKEAKHYSRPLKMVSNIIITLIAVILILNLHGLQGSVVGILSAAGFLGIVVGFAAKDTLGNFIAGLIILIDKPFLIGDWVAISDIEGEVIDIHVASTRIRSWDGELVTVPNSMVINEKIINRTLQGKLRVKVQVGVDYSTDIKSAVKIAQNLLIKDKRILDEPEPQVLVKEFGESAINLELRGWMEPDKDSTVAIKNDLHHQLKEEFDKHGITIPFPQVTVSKR
jgi:small-conductance mechanosensitive channel